MIDQKNKYITIIGAGCSGLTLCVNLVKNKYRNIECKICKVEENTEHLFKCQKYLDLNEKVRGGTLQEILKNNKEDDIAKIIKEIIKRKNDENKTENTRRKTTNTAPLFMGLSLPDGRE